MLLKNNVIHIQTKVDTTRIGIASFDETAEPYVEYTEGGSKLIFVLRKNTTKRCFKREIG